MFSFQIKKQVLIDCILEYIYKNKENIKKYKKDYGFLVTRIKHDDIRIGLGFGIYTFMFENEEIIISYLEEGKPKGIDMDVEYYKRFILKSKNEEILKKFLITSYEYEKKINDKLTGIFITNDYGEWYLYNKIPSRTLDSIYLESNIKNKITDDINNFLKSEEEYNKFGIPYKRTYLLTGIPGSGKTSMVKAICNHFGYSLSILSISKKFDNSSLMTAIKDIEEKTILLLEDIDSLFDKREGTQDNPSITFSNLINVLDGVLYKHATIIFLTTNHPEKLDHALLRIGRIDMILEFNYPSKNILEKLFSDILNESYDKEIIKKEFNKFYNLISSKKITMSAIMNFLFRYKKNWEDNISDLLDTNNFIQKTLKKDKMENLYS